MLPAAWKARLDRWAESYRNWVGDRHMELAIRAELREGGYPLSRSKVLDFRIVAIERPGWVCVYLFQVATEDAEGEPTTLYGIVRDDSRVRSAVKLYTDPRRREAQRAEWSEGLIVPRGYRS